MAKAVGSASAVECGGKGVEDSGNQVVECRALPTGGSAGFARGGGLRRSRDGFETGCDRFQDGVLDGISVGVSLGVSFGVSLRVSVGASVGFSVGVSLAEHSRF
jgi:hypothetical protein